LRWDVVAVAAVAVVAAAVRFSLAIFLMLLLFSLLFLMLLQYKYLDVKKNRFDGELGIVPLNFSPHTSSFYEDPALMDTIKARMAANSSTKKWGK
jgi:hypothetical protein